MYGGFKIWRNNIMRKLILVRHCKSSWSDLSLSDYDRPLNARGKNDGMIMSKYLSEKFKNIDMLLSSSSNRTKLTSEFFINRMKFKNKKFTDRLYHASEFDIINILKSLENKINSILIIGHNPGFTELVNFLSDINLYNLPTTGIVVFNLRISNWSDIDKNIGEIEIIKFPKHFKS